jgi:hypothetical protein
MNDMRPPLEFQVPFWDAVNQFAESPKCSTARATAVAGINELVAQEFTKRDKRIAELKAEVTRVRGLIDRDRTGLAAGLSDVLLAIRAHSWLETDEWGSYAYDERTVETLRKEIRFCFDDVRTVATGALRASGALASSAFHPESSAQPQLPIVDDRAVQVQREERAELPPWSKPLIQGLVNACFQGDGLDDDEVAELMEGVLTEDLRACGIEVP